MKRTLELSQGEQAALAFLRDDFNQCFEQVRYYDSQIIGILKFLFVVYTFLTGVVTALHQFLLGQMPALRLPAVLTLSVGLCLGIFLYAVIIRNRIYFVKAARYINEQRAFFKSFKPLGFEIHAAMYDRSDRPLHFNWVSSQSGMIYTVAFLNTMVLISILVFASGMMTTVWGAVLGAIFFLLQLGIAIIVLKSRDV